MKTRLTAAQARELSAVGKQNLEERDNQTVKDVLEAALQCIDAAAARGEYRTEIPLTWTQVELGAEIIDELAELGYAAFISHGIMLRFSW